MLSHSERPQQIHFQRFTIKNCCIYNSTLRAESPLIFLEVNAKDFAMLWKAQENS